MQLLSFPRRWFLASVGTAACLTFVVASPAAAIGPSPSDPSNPPPPPPPPVVVAPPSPPSQLDPYDPV
jgi:hypothetical protein